MATTRRSPTALLVPTVVLILLGIQLAQGFGGFDRPGGLLTTPGVLLGWGGVAVLLVLFAWLIMGWWGRDLFDLQGAGGLVVRLVGCLALGVALAGLAGVGGGAAAGGSIGAWLAHLLEGLLGGVLAVLVLLLMTAPSFLLSISPFFHRPSSDKVHAYPSGDRLASLEPPPGLFERSARDLEGHYPARCYDEDGNEIPMTFDARDVGPARYADDPASVAARQPPPPPEPVEPPPPDTLPPGVHFADEFEESPQAAFPEERLLDDPAPAGVPLPDGVRFQDEGPDEG
ncbi:MAG: hypothetical protein ACC662_06490, partial [Planctomycetota bacterium]